MIISTQEQHKATKEIQVSGGYREFWKQPESKVIKDYW